MPSFIPIDVMNTQPQSGGGGLPEGFYILQVIDATEVRAEQNQQFMRRLYKTKVLMGPNASQEAVNRPFTDAIRENDPQWAGRHMELFVAAFGSVDAVRGVAQGNGGGVPPETLHGRTYIAQIVKNDKYSNIVQRLPYTQENWAACVGGNGAPAAQASAASAQAAPSPAGGMLVNQSVQQPTFQQPPAFQQPPQMQASQWPSQQQMGQWPSQQQGGRPPAPQGGGAPPPPPPPGFPSTGK
jgi:hypothetical protein